MRWANQIVKRDLGLLSYHNRSVPGLSTIEMSPSFDFTRPRKKRVFSFAASLVAKGDERLDSENENA